MQSRESEMEGGGILGGIGIEPEKGSETWRTSLAKAINRRKRALGRESLNQSRVLARGPRSNGRPGGCVDARDGSLNKNRRLMTRRITTELKHQRPGPGQRQITTWYYWQRKRNIACL